MKERNPLEKAIKIYGEWFQDGKNKREDFFSKLKLINFPVINKITIFVL